MNSDLGVRLIDPVRHDRHDDFVGNQIAARHDVLGATPDRRAGRYRGTQHVTGRKLHDTVLIHETLSLRALSRSRRTEQDKPHLLRPLSFERLIRPSYWCANK